MWAGVRFPGASQTCPRAGGPGKFESPMIIPGKIHGSNHIAPARRHQRIDVSHRAFGLYAHITWHTRLRQPVVRSADAEIIRAVVQEAATRWQVHVLAFAVLSDHVHIVASFRPERNLTSFIRHAKSESARRVNLARGMVLQWARGYFVKSLSRSHMRATCAYVARQHLRHPDRVPS
jgi:REP element-mobilizing transposase RayT